MFFLSKNLIHILERTLNLMDYRIVDHCERVTYIVLEMLKEEGGYSTEELVEICFLCTLHDIGAYKTEQIDTLVDVGSSMGFDIQNTVGHAVYGYLFLKKFAALERYEDALLYHHIPYKTLVHTCCKNKDLAGKIFLADRVDMFLQNGRLRAIDERMLGNFRDGMFSGHDIDLLIELEARNQISKKLMNRDYNSELLAFYEQIYLSREQVVAFLRTIAYAIDFRSKFTVMHTMTTVGVSVEIAKIMQLSEADVEKIYFGALLHDVGKVATSTMILEKAGKLDSYEYLKMQDHIVVTEQILKDLVDEDIFRIASRHHEKLDGSGYPHGLTEKDLTISECIVCVADIFSALSGQRSYKEVFSAEKIQSILREMADKNKIHSGIVAVVMDNYSRIEESTAEIYQQAMQYYAELSREYQALCTELISYN